MHARTRRQQEVLEVIRQHIEADGYRPSYQRIATFLGLRSRAGIARIVGELEEQGLLERRHDNGHFSLEMKGNLGGIPLEWLRNGHEPETEWESTPLVVPEFLIGGYPQDELRVFRLTDRSMSPEIEENDIAIVEMRDFCREGQPVVAELPEGDIVLRRYYCSNGEIELRPGNNAFEPIFAKANRTRILGVQRGLIRPAT